MRLLHRLHRAIVAAASVALVAASCVLTYSVVVRYVSPRPTDWQDEFSVFLLIGVTFLSSAWVQSQRGHIGIEAIRGLLSPTVDRIRQCVVDIASALFCGFFAWKSWTLLHEAWTEGYVSESSWAPPLWIPYLAMSLGMSLLTLQILAQALGARAPEQADITEAHF